MIGSYPINTFLNFKNNFPCRGFVKKSDNMSKGGQYYNFTSDLSTPSFAKKYLIRVSLEFTVEELRPFSTLKLCFECPDAENYFYYMSLHVYEHK